MTLTFALVTSSQRTQSYGTTFLCYSKIDTRVSAHGSRSKSADQSTLSVRRQVVACRSQENECTYSCWLTFLLWQKNESTRRGAMMQTAQAFEATHTTRVQAHDAMHTLTMHDACGICVGASRQSRTESAMQRGTHSVLRWRSLHAIV